MGSDSNTKILLNKNLEHKRGWLLKGKGQNKVKKAVECERGGGIM
jgi:hypothetical protein